MAYKISVHTRIITLWDFLTNLVPFFFFFNMDKEIVQGFLAIVVSSIQDYPEMP